MTKNEFLKLVASDMVFARKVHGFISTLEVEMADAGIEISQTWHTLGPFAARDYLVEKIKEALDE